MRLAPVCSGMGKTNLQITVERERAVYTSMPRPLLSQLCRIHGLSVRDFASIFQISKSHAEEVLNHKKYPSLDLAFKIARYWETDVDTLFGWMFDDDGQRRPLVVEIPGGKGEVWRLSTHNPIHKTIPLVKYIAKRLREMEEEEKKCSTSA